MQGIGLVNMPHPDYIPLVMHTDQSSGRTVAPETWKFAGLEFFFWASVVALEGFLVPYLAHIGLGSGATGFIMSSIFLASIVIAPLWGAICDAGDRHRRVMLGAFALAAVAVLLIPLVGPRFLPVFLLGVLYSGTANSMPGILDSWIMRRKRDVQRIEYGMARGFGSAGFAVGGLLLGRLIDLTAPGAMFPFYAFTVALAGLMVLRLPGGVRPGVSQSGTIKGDESEQPVHAVADRAVAVPVHDYSGNAVRAIFSSTPYLVFLVVSLLIFVQLRAALTFLPLLIYEAGGSSTHVGLAQAVSAGGEIPFMFATVLMLRRFRPRALLLFSMAVFVVRIGVIGWIASPGGLVAVQLLHGLSFGVFLPVSIHYIDSFAPVRYSTIFQTTATSVHFGIGSVIGSSLSGLMVEAVGLRAMYRLLPIPAAIATLLFAGYLLYETRGQMKERIEPGA